MRCDKCNVCFGLFVDSPYFLVLDANILCRKCARKWRVPIFNNHLVDEKSFTIDLANDFALKSWNRALVYDYKSQKPIRECDLSEFANPDVHWRYRELCRAMEERIEPRPLKTERLIAYEEFDHSIKARVNPTQMISELRTQSDCAEYYRVQCAGCAMEGWWNTGIGILGDNPWDNIIDHDGKVCLKVAQVLVNKTLGHYNLGKLLKLCK